MSRAKFTALAGLIDSDEEDLDVFARTASHTATLPAIMAPTKNSRTAPTNRVTKAPRANSKTTTAKLTRNVLAEKNGNVHENSTGGRGTKRPASEDIQEPEEQNTEDKPRTGRGRPRANKAQKIAEPEDELSEIQLDTAAPAPAKRGRKPKTNVDSQPAEPEVPETQQPDVEIPETQHADIADISIESEEHIEDLPLYIRQGMSSAQRLQPQAYFSASRRPVSASDSELHDPSLRRRIGELTRKYESLEAKYRDLREIGVKEAERNFDRLKKQGEERADTDKQLIMTLKAQLAAQTAVAKDAEQLQQQLKDSQSQVDELQSNLDKMQGALVETKTEIKTLSTKLAAARSAEQSNVKVPGSAMKNNHSSNRLIATAEAAAQLAQKKENLYGDLTGLLVCGVKRENDEEVFDCVQTGRNGTLHFKLAIGVDGSSDKFDDAQFMYMPQLDAARDEELMDTLPDYLVEEITFPRLHAAKFYSRVVKALSERPE
ncbi:hypothetical protein F5Y19DRAFT_51264 [Xylariaceae sp. FL1651]|nr:hypothetical protein F5Y19DRAFT_51264 [Xylariaceae sp. FL1651]